MFDVCNRASFDALGGWLSDCSKVFLVSVLHQLQYGAIHAKVAVIGTKVRCCCNCMIKQSDMPGRAVSTVEASKFCDGEGFK